MIDLTYLKTTTENNTNLILQLVEIFKTQLPEIKKNLINAYINGECAKLKGAAHKAKNSFKMMGLDQSSENLKQMEFECAKTENINCDENIDYFIKEYDIIYKNIEQKIKELRKIQQN